MRGVAFWMLAAGAAWGQATVPRMALFAARITEYLKNAGTLEHARAMANHSWPRTAKLDDRRADEVSLDEY